jgi:hypothetical protein
MTRRNLTREVAWEMALRAGRREANHPARERCSPEASWRDLGGAATQGRDWTLDGGHLVF